MAELFSSEFPAGKHVSISMLDSRATKSMPPTRRSSFHIWLCKGTDCPEKLLSLPHWKYSRTGWTQYCATALGWPCMSREVGPDDWLWSLPTLSILPLCESSSSKIILDCILKQSPLAESHSRQGQGNWNQQCCTMNLTSYEIVIDSLCGQQSRHTGQETGNAGINVQSRREDTLHNPPKAHHIQHTIMQ